jgi:hypothetical protein
MMDKKNYIIKKNPILDDTFIEEFKCFDFLKEY